MNKQEFLDRAREKHGYKYQYPNLSDKVLSNQYIDIIYNGVLYKQKVVKHILLGRCPEKNTPVKTTEQFISEARKVWGDKYDYSLSKYTGSLDKIKIIYDGIVFEQVAISHLRKMATEDNYNQDYFIKKSKDKWGDKYDYSLVEFINSKNKVKILYNGIVYEQSPSNHLKYAPERIITLKSTDEFINQCNIIHNYKYLYDNTIYTKSKNKVIITCKIHGDFTQVSNSHLMGMGCIKCGYNNDRIYNHKYDTCGFIEESKRIWGDKYDYSLVEYKNIKTKVKIIHDGIIYEQTPSLHLRFPVEGYLNQDIFIKKSIKKWGDKYDYSLVNFTNCHNKVKIIHDGIIYEQLPNNHLNYAPEKILRKSQEEFISESKEFHGNKYSYDKVLYTNGLNKVTLVCPKHGDFLQSPNVHLRSGCPHCNESKGEKEISKFLNKYNIINNRQHKFHDCKNILQLPFDFFIPHIRTCIEFDGIQHYEPVEYFGGLKAYESLKINDKIKSDYCEDNYISLIRIRYDQIEDIYRILWDNLKTHIKK